MLPMRRGVRVRATHPSGLLAFEKPPGLLSHPNKHKDGKLAFLEADYDQRNECYRWDNGGQLFLVHRLDSPTSGILLGALTVDLAVAVKKVFAAHRVTKRYYALVAGVPRRPAGFWEDRILKSLRGHRLRVEPVRGAGACGRERTAKTRFTQVAIGSRNGSTPLALLSLEPLTGRTHQLRVQCALHQLPIVGDRTYGNFVFNRKAAAASGMKRLFLHAADVQLAFDFAGNRHRFSATAPLPNDFQTMLAKAPLHFPKTFSSRDGQDAR